MPHRNSKNFNIIKLFDPYLPPSVLDNSRLNLEDLIRSRVLVSVLLSGLVVTLVSVLTLLISDYFSPDTFVAPVSFGGFSFFVVLLIYIFFYKTGRLEASAVIFSLAFFIMAVISIILTGGFKSPIMPILACIPVVAFLIGGREEGTYNAALSYVVATVLLILDAYDFPMMQLLTEEVASFTAGIVWFITISVIVVCLYVYDTLLEESRNTIVHEKKSDQI